MALRGFVCPNCRTWFEGEGNHPRCPLCGTRAGPGDLLDARRPPDAAQAGAAQGPGGEPDASWRYEEAPRYEAPPPAPDYETPAGLEQAPEYEAPPRFEEAEGYRTPAPADTAPGEAAPPQPAGEESRFGQLIGVLIFVAIIASQVCRALTDSE